MGQETSEQNTQTHVFEEKREDGWVFSHMGVDTALLHHLSHKEKWKNKKGIPEIHTDPTHWWTKPSQSLRNESNQITLSFLRGKRGENKEEQMIFFPLREQT